jgi:hypothetical protein
MVEIQPVRMLREFTVPDTIRTAGAEALFLSTLQPSESPSPDRVCRTVATMLRRLGLAECGSQFADEYGNHPDTAVARMRWALTTIDTVYATTSVVPSTQQCPLAVAS